MNIEYYVSLGDIFWKTTFLTEVFPLRFSPIITIVGRYPSDEHSSAIEPVGIADIVANDISGIGEVIKEVLIGTPLWLLTLLEAPLEINKPETGEVLEKRCSAIELPAPFVVSGVAGNTSMSLPSPPA